MEQLQLEQLQLYKNGRGIAYYRHSYNLKTLEKKQQINGIVVRIRNHK